MTGTTNRREHFTGVWCKANSPFKHEPKRAVLRATVHRENVGRVSNMVSLSLGARSRSRIFCTRKCRQLVCVAGRRVQNQPTDNFFLIGAVHESGQTPSGVRSGRVGSGKGDPARPDARDISTS